MGWQKQGGVISLGLGLAFVLGAMSAASFPELNDETIYGVRRIVVGGAPVVVPVVECPTSEGECVEESEADASCQGGANGSDVECYVDWGSSVGYKTLDTIWIWYGPATLESQYRTTGSDKNYVTPWHAPDDVHDATNWIVNYSGGTPLAGCEDFRDHSGYSAHTGWHGQDVTGHLARDQSPWNGGTCNTGNATGWYGAGVTFDD